MKAHLTLAVALLLICTGTGAALAQTPDGMPPANETICNGESGAAFGLCNAYCEAMDCELDEPQASATACSRVRTKFQNITGHDLPCECPCNDPAVSQLFFDIVAGEVPLDGCFTNYFELETGVLVTAGFPIAAAGTVNGEGICAALDGQASPLPPGQGASCADLLEQAAVAQGLACVTLP